RLFALTKVAAEKKIVYKFFMLIFLPAISLLRRQKIFCATFIKKSGTIMPISPVRPLAVLLTFIAFFFCAVNVQAASINAKSAILMDVTTGRILYEQHADMRIPPASLTKVLSMYVALNAISSGKVGYGDKVKISPAAARTGGSRLGLKSGEYVTLDKLFYGMAVASGNDASVAVAEHVAGSTGAFVKRMNALARKLGMKHSRFVNVHGLPAEGQITTARDMLKLARSYQAHYPKSRKYHLADSVTHNGNTEPNHNPLTGSYPGLDGLKTGWVNAAGYNIIATAKQKGHKLIAVILGSPNTGIRAAEARRLLNAGFLAVAKKKKNAYGELGVSAKQPALLKKSPSSTSKPAPKKKKPSPKKSSAKTKNGKRL
ncbi:MAG: D-alanyl-D-alanine carboxypeptidase family protein, partial [Mailhella sp.]